MKTYSWQTNHVLINGMEVEGWADGDDVLGIERLTDLASHKVGVDGRMVVSLSADKSGQVVIKLFQTSDTNKYLLALAALQGGGPRTFIPIVFLWQDSYRQDVGAGVVGYLKAVPKVTRGQTAAVHEWTIIVERLDLALGAPAFTGAATAIAEALGG